jgi:carboxynorspermidine decarboxylase
MTSDNIEEIIRDPALRTPAFICLQERLLENCRRVRRIADAIQVRSLFSLKALTLPALLPPMAEILDGFSVSSLFEARLARECGGEVKIVHLTTPAIRPSEAPRLAEVCSHASLNSLGELERWGAILGGHLEVGLRINPGLSFANDPRYDPCAPESRLGVAIDLAEDLAKKRPSVLTGLRGLHVHNNCESEDFDQLRTTAERVGPLLDLMRPYISWVNLGGGYYFPDSGVPHGLWSAVNVLRSAFSGLQIYLEPGTAIAQDAGLLVTTVLDIIERRGGPLAILDTTINHIPEVSEYQYMPDVYASSATGSYTYRLTGCSCLAGDVFGDCRFDNPLGIGDRVCFVDVGSYSLVKTNMFNGIPAPSLYIRKSGGLQEAFCGPTYERWAGYYEAANPSDVDL